MKGLSIDKCVKLLYKYIILICIIWGSKDTWLSRNNNWFMYGGMIAAIILLLPLIIRKNVNLFRLKKVGVLMLLVCLSMAVNFDFRGYSMFIVLTIALFITETIDFEQFYKIFDNIILLISLLSIIATICKIANQFVFPSKLIYIADNEAIPWGFRLYGTFREPAMYCIYIGLALGRQLFFLEKPSLIRLFIYLSTLLLTGSATGYISVIFALICFIAIKMSFKKYFLLYVIGIMSIIMAGQYFGILEYFFRRLSIHGDSAYSSNSRYYSIIGGAFVGITHPFFGAGAVKSEIKFQEFMNYLERGAAWANMVTYLWASFGTFFIYIFLKGIYNTAFVKKKAIAFSFLVFILLLLCGETMTYSSIMYIFMLYGYHGQSKQGYFLKAYVKRSDQYAV